MKKLTHINPEGRASMVDVSGKPDQVRTAIARGHILLNPKTLNQIKDNLMKKGDVLAIAEIAGIQGGKSTSSLIPLCHPLRIDKIDVKATPDKTGITVESFAKCTGPTGIEMEALTAVSVALLTIWDMCKAVDGSMVIEEVRLVGKEKK